MSKQLVTERSYFGGIRCTRQLSECFSCSKM